MFIRSDYISNFNMQHKYVHTHMIRIVSLCIKFAYDILCTNYKYFIE
jgi:hypothetical protein